MVTMALAQEVDQNLGENTTGKKPLPSRGCSVKLRFQEMRLED